MSSLPHWLRQPWAHWRRQPWIGPAVVFALSLVFFGALFHQFPVLYDTDSYYHLAIARAYHRHGIIDSLPWAQLSLLHEFADKELLFHLALAPTADTAEPTAGGRWMLAGFNALVVAALAFLGQQAIGRWGLLTPLLLYAGSLDFVSRMIRLRPEILSLLLMLVATWCAANRRYRWLGLVAGLYTLSYTAFQALLGLCGAWFAQQLWGRGRREWSLILYPILGVALALLLHPHFPHHLAIWKVQNFDFFTGKNLLNVGGEINPQSSRDLLVDNLPWALGLIILWRAATRRAAPRDDPMADFLGISALIFGLLFLAMQRFSIYFIPFTTLAVFYDLRRRGATLTPWTRLPWRGRAPLALGLALVLALGIPRTAELLQNLAKTRGNLSRENEWNAFGRALPPGARVATEWGSTHLYMFWAPQATFLNVLDPIFMAIPYPQAYAALRAIFEGREPDIPMTLASELGSEYIALSTYHQNVRLRERLAADPRLSSVHQAHTSLYQVTPDANTHFVLDWRIIPAGSRLPLADEDATVDLLPYPRFADQKLRAIEGYVDGRRISEHSGTANGGCIGLVHQLPATDAETSLVYELAPYGPTRIWLDQDPLVAIDQPSAAVLGQGVTFPVHLDPGAHRLTVLTCPGAEQRTGFFLRRR